MPVRVASGAVPETPAPLLPRAAAFPEQEVPWLSPVWGLGSESLSFQSWL